MARAAELATREQLCRKSRIGWHGPRNRKQKLKGSANAGSIRIRSRLTLSELADQSEQPMVEGSANAKNYSAIHCRTLNNNNGHNVQIA